MVVSALPDLDQLNNEALKALAMQLSGDHAALLDQLHQQRETAARQEEELAALEAEFAAQRQKLSEQSDELRSRSEQIEHLKLVIEKLDRKSVV